MTPQFGIIGVSLSSEPVKELPTVDQEEAQHNADRAAKINEDLFVRTRGVPNLVGQLIVPPYLAGRVLDLLGEL